jgi:leucyl aminopeptidase
MPLHPGYDPLVRSAVADLSNSAKKRQAGAVYAARFLREFAEGTPWCHVDVAGTAMQGDHASGFGVRLAADVAQRVARLG